MILDHKGKPIPQPGAGFVPTVAVKPRPAKEEKATADCIEFTVYCETYYPLVDCKK